MSEINWNSKEFSILSSQKKAFLQQITKEADNIPSNASIAYLSSIIKILNSSGISFTPDEQKLVISTLMKDNPNINTQKINLLLNMLNNR